MPATPKKPTKAKATRAKQAPLKLSLACGDHKPDGFKGVDIIKTASADYKVDLLKFPWKPFKNNSVDEIECSNFVEH
ncbi:hypothetical protein KC963_01015, partial [Candidatus Saccharibacteria bacterium]|nr:hypothetical protein [Candidatus Saccharibacteria bacterium]